MPTTSTPGRIRLAFATSNPGKVAEAREILEPYGIRVVWKRRTLPEPQASSLETVVRAKLAAVRSRGRDPILVEDSGIFLSALDGFPGVYSRYAFETIGNEGLLRLVKGRDRRATFRAVVGIGGPHGVRIAVGEVHGTLPARPRGTNGFGFDPIFVPRGARRTFAELTREEKGRVSHRGRALHALGKSLRAYGHTVGV